MNLHATHRNDYDALDRVADRHDWILVSAACIGEDRFACLVAPNLYRDTRAAVVLVDFADENDAFEDPCFFQVDSPHLLTAPHWVTQGEAFAILGREALAAR